MLSDFVSKIMFTPKHELPLCEAYFIDCSFISKTYTNCYCFVPFRLGMTWGLDEGHNQN